MQLDTILVLLAAALLACIWGWFSARKQAQNTEKFYLARISQIKAELCQKTEVVKIHEDASVYWKEKYTKLSSEYQKLVEKRTAENAAIRRKPRVAKKLGTQSQQ